MKLLIVTQKVDEDDSNLGFFHRWIEEFAKNVESVLVVCLYKGRYKLPENVRVLSLGKEEGKSRLKYLYKFYKYIWEEKKNYEAVFVHMNPIYTVLGGPFWKGWDKKIALWYVHKAVDWKLRVAEKFSDIIFTVADKTFRLKSKKVKTVGHGIDVERFTDGDNKMEYAKSIRIITAGRISKTKNTKILVDVLGVLREDGINSSLWIVGDPITDDGRKYLEEIKNSKTYKKYKDEIHFVGSVKNKDIHKFYEKGGIFVNLGDSGGVDKAALEAMSSGLVVLTSNEAFEEILPKRYMISKDATVVAKRILEAAKEKPGKELQEYVRANHNLVSLIQKIIKNIKSV